MVSADEKEDCTRQLEQQHESSSVELCPDSRDEHVTAMGRTEVCSTAGVEEGYAGPVPRTQVECSSHNLELNPLVNRQPVENIT